MRREEEGHGRDGDLRIDFESGVAVINVQPESEADEDVDPTADTRVADRDDRDADQGHASDGTAAGPSRSDA
jgi:hypothetical protein